MKNFVLTFIFVFLSAALPAQGISRALTTYFTFDMSGNPDGVYILKVSVENNEGTKKIVKD